MGIYGDMIYYTHLYTKQLNLTFNFCGESRIGYVLRSVVGGSGGRHRQRRESRESLSFQSGEEEYVW